MKEWTLLFVGIVLAGIHGSVAAAPKDSAPASPLPAEPWSLECSAPAADERLRSRRGPLPRILYLNRSGGTYHPGKDDSRSNLSSRVPYLVTPGPWEVDDATWVEVISCVRDLFGDFDVEITDQDPGDEAHQEAVVTTSAGPIAGPSIGGVAPGRYCGGVTDAVVFVFTDVLAAPDGSPNPDTVCWVVAHELGHSLGLDHTLLCSDPMSYRGGCQKNFGDVYARCGEHDSRECECGGDSQNSFRRLLEQVSTVEDVPLPLGAACADHDDCGSGSCLSVGDRDPACTYSCGPSSSAVCPPGFSCEDSLCTAAAGGCSTAGRGSGGLGLWLVLLIAASRRSTSGPMPPHRGRRGVVRSVNADWVRGFIGARRWLLCVRRERRRRRR